MERPLTIFLNGQEIVTAMTIGDHPDWLAAGYLLNQGMLKAARDITSIDHDEELGVVVVRTSDADELRGAAQKAHPDLGLRPGHDVRRAHGELRGRQACGRCRDPDELALRAHEDRQHDAVALSEGGRHPWLRAGAGRAGARLSRGRRSAQCGGQDRRVDGAQ